MIVLWSSTFSQCLRALRSGSTGPRSFSAQVDKQPLVKAASLSRSDWERSRRNAEDAYAQTRPVEPYHRHGLMRNHTGFGRPQTHKSKTGTNFIAKLQSVSGSTPKSDVSNLLMEISQHIDELNAYELVDIGYYLTRVNSPDCAQVVEPILHRFFSLPERHSCLNGVYIHRLLRTMFIYQDVTYRVWVYEVAQIVGIKHKHLLMRDVQLIIDDLSLFYDAAAQSVLTNFEDIIIKRAHELEISRLPLVIHALGRSGYNTIQVAKVIHEVYMQNKGHPDFYLCHHIGLLLKGYATFHFHPGQEFLDDVWIHLKDSIKTAEFKYISWLGESFLKLGYVKHAPEVLDELLNKQHLLSHLEFTDFISGCWSIQSYLLAKEFRPYIKASENTEIHTPVETDDPDENNATVQMLYRYYKKLAHVVMVGMPSKIYNSTPPYRATQFELLTRLLVIYPNPRDFRDIMPLRKYDAVYPLITFPSMMEPRRGEIDYIFKNHTHLQASKLFGDGHSLNDILKYTDESSDAELLGPLELNHELEPLSAKLKVCDKEPKLQPLPDLLKQYLHSLFFRTPALAPRGIRIMLQGLVRIHFEQREDCVMEPDLLPQMKTEFYSRPFSRTIIREIYRKLACYNTDDLLITLYCMFPLRLFELELAPRLLSQLTGMWLHQVGEGLLTREQRQLISLFYDTLRINENELYNRLDVQELQTIMHSI
ncbi:hypothetical protein X943_003691 [Babesia divergens]|uniref:Uncharacterized protein n=1 Tax=Babesia divergens TaxID=32595 RepID=A0AAD9LEG6_BABDI|nr:hypothetical protein X943_003691 [Babesia divergens]